MSKTCDYCKQIGPAYTFVGGETMCLTCLSELPTDPMDGRRLVHSLRAEVTRRLTHDLANERVVSGYAKQLKDEVERLREELPKYMRRIEELERNLTAHHAALLDAEAEREKYKVALELIAGDPEWRTHKLSRIAEQAVRGKASEQDELVTLRGEVERLRDWKGSVLNGIKGTPEFNGMAWAGDKEGWGFCFEYKAALEWAIKESGGGETYLREGVAKILSAEAVQS